LIYNFFSEFFFLFFSFFFWLASEINTNTIDPLSWLDFGFSINPKMKKDESGVNIEEGDEIISEEIVIVGNNMEIEEGDVIIGEEIVDVDNDIYYENVKKDIQNQNPKMSRRVFALVIDSSNSRPNLHGEKLSQQRRKNHRKSISGSISTHSLRVPTIISQQKVSSNTEMGNVLSSVSSTFSLPKTGLPPPPPKAPPRRNSSISATDNSQPLNPQQSLGDQTSALVNSLFSQPNNQPPPPSSSQSSSQTSSTNNPLSTFGFSSQPSNQPPPPSSSQSSNQPQLINNTSSVLNEAFFSFNSVEPVNPPIYGQTSLPYNQIPPTGFLPQPLVYQSPPFPGYSAQPLNPQQGYWWK
jgi:hypothetical protein